MAPDMVHGFIRDADRKNRVWLKVNASPARAAAEKWRDARSKHLVVCETGNGRPAVGQVVRYGLFDPHYEVSAGGAQRIAALPNIIARRYFHAA
jgi:hypothetical protein